jgi:hypothetical protein
MGWDAATRNVETINITQKISHTKLDSNGNTNNTSTLIIQATAFIKLHAGKFIHP